MIILRQALFTNNRAVKKEAWKSAKRFVDKCMEGNMSDPSAIKAANKYRETFSPYLSSCITGQPFPKYLENMQKKAQKYAVKKSRKRGMVIKSSDI